MIIIFQHTLHLTKRYYIVRGIYHDILICTNYIMVNRIITIKTGGDLLHLL